MQKRVGLLYLSRDSRRILLILENEKWTVPTFSLENSVIEDSEDLQQKFSRGKIIPIELYLSKDKGFEYGTYICLVKEEFITEENKVEHSVLYNKPETMVDVIMATV